MKKNLIWALFSWIIVACGLSRAQVIDATDLWFQYMANPATDGPRVYLRTERDILQTGKSSATFQRGSVQFVVADGAVGAIWRDQDIRFPEEWDTDRDGTRDIIEFQYEQTVGATPAGTIWALDPRYQPPAQSFQPDVLWTQLANGAFLPVNPAGGSAAAFIRPFAGNDVRIKASPPSDLPRPTVLTDYSTSYYITNPTSSEFSLLGLALYSWNRNYPTPSDGSAMEKQIVPGTYTIEFPTVAANTMAQAQVTHRVVPNGTLHIGTYKNPTWLIRSVEVVERFDKPPVQQQFTNGRWVFDPSLPTTLKWDNLVLAGIANAATDQISMRVLNEAEEQIWPPTGGSVILNINASQINLQMGPLYGIPGLTGAFSPLSLNGFIILDYTRSLSSGSTGDVSSVSLKVPVQFKQSYESWRRLFFFGNDATNDSISGPLADPDGDGINNQTEFDLGSDPTNPPYFVTTSGSTNVAGTTASVLGTTGGDGSVPIVSRGVVYSETSQNSLPQLGGVGVVNYVDAETIGPFQADLTGLNENTNYTYRAYIITPIGLFYSTPFRNFTTTQLALVNNPTAANITVSSATLGGTVVSSGGQTVTERGVVYSPTSLNSDPFIGDTDTTTVSTTGGLGVFTLAVNGLTIGTEYSFRAYAVTSSGIAYSDVADFSTPATLPSAPSGFVTNVAATSATFISFLGSNGGSPIIDTGIVLSVTSINNSPQIGGVGVVLVSGVGDSVISTTAFGLDPATTYSYRAYATNAIGTAYDPIIQTFTTPSAPTVINPTFASVTGTTATLGGTITSNGGAALTQRGVVYSSTDMNPVIGAVGVITKVASGTSTGVFTTGVTALTPGTTYYVRAYATNAAGTSYTPSVASFTTTASIPTLNAPTIAAITATSATLGATVTSDGGSAISSRGVIYSLTATNSNPTIGGPGVTIVPTGGTTGAFTVPVAGLQAGSQYTFKAFASNIAGVGYGSPFAFFTTFTVPTVAIGDITNVTDSAATVDGAVISDGGRTVTEFGVVYSEDPNPIVGGAGVFKEVGAGNMSAFSVNLTGLNASSTYYVKAYAFNEGGFGYSTEETFFTPALSFLLLGSPQVAWVDEPVVLAAPQQSDPDDPLIAQSQSSPEPSNTKILEFIYKKHDSEIGLVDVTYLIETTTDYKKWAPLDNELWSFHNEETEVKAIWINPDVSPPARLFFRMKAHR